MNDQYLPTATYDKLLNELLNLPPHFDRRTQLVELLGAAGIWPVTCRDDAERNEA